MKRKTDDLLEHQPPNKKIKIPEDEQYRCSYCKLIKKYKIRGSHRFNYREETRICDDCFESCSCEICGKKQDGNIHLCPDCESLCDKSHPVLLCEKCTGKVHPCKFCDAYWDSNFCIIETEEYLLMCRQCANTLTEILNKCPNFVEENIKLANQ